MADRVGAGVYGRQESSTGNRDESTLEKANAAERSGSINNAIVVKSAVNLVKGQGVATSVGRAQLW